MQASAKRISRDSYGANVARSVQVTDLVGAMEIAQRLGASRPQTVYAWRGRHADFPAPVAELSIGLVWAWPDVEAWARRTGRI